MTRFLDPFGLLAGTWNWMCDHGGGGFAALLAVAVMVAAHLVVLAFVVAVVINPGRLIEAARGFAAGVQDPSSRERPLD
jgi:hypothetical protein